MIIWVFGGFHDVFVDVSLILFGFKAFYLMFSVYFSLCLLLGLSGAGSRKVFPRPYHFGLVAGPFRRFFSGFGTSKVLTWCILVDL